MATKETAIRVACVGLGIATALVAAEAYRRYRTPRRRPDVVTERSTPASRRLDPLPEDDSLPEEVPGSPQVKPRLRDRRNAVSSEPTTVDPSRYVRRVIHKTVSDLRSISAAVRQNILFQGIEEDARQEIFNAMCEKQFRKGDLIIEQGTDGDYFYVIDEGEVEITKHNDGETKVLVPRLGKGGSFGELALIYNSPRAATVKALSDCRLWALERTVYRQILMVHTIEKRKLYESFLEGVKILQDLTKWERMTVADALESVTFGAGEVVIRQRDPGDRFYIVVEGEANVIKDGHMLATLCRADYFGEIALLTDQPRAATVVAATELKCVTLDSACFKRVLGPCEDILRRDMVNYNRYMTEKI